MKYCFYIFLAYMSTAFSYASDPLSQDDLKTAIIPNSSNNVLSAGTSSETGESFLDALFMFARDSIFWLLAVIAIGMFLFIWWRLVIARWNPEEFKKALKSFIYAAIGIFVVAAAWAMVRLIAWLDI